MKLIAFLHLLLHVDSQPVDKKTFPHKKHHSRCHQHVVQNDTLRDKVPAPPTAHNCKQVTTPAGPNAGASACAHTMIFFVIFPRDSIRVPLKSRMMSHENPLLWTVLPLQEHLLCRPRLSRCFQTL